MIGNLRGSYREPTYSKPRPGSAVDLTIHPDMHHAILWTGLLLTDLTCRNSPPMLFFDGILFWLASVASWLYTGSSEHLVVQSTKEKKLGTIALTM